MSGTKDGPPITVEQLAALPLEFQTLVRAILDYYEGRITKLQAELARLRAELFAPAQHPAPSCQTEAAEASISEAAWRAAWPPQARTVADSGRSVRRCPDAEADGVQAL